MLSTLATSQIRQNELKDSFILQGSGLDLRGGDGDGHVAVGTRQDMAIRSHIAYKAKFFSKAMRICITSAEQKVWAKFYNTRNTLNLWTSGSTFINFASRGRERIAHKC